MRVALLGGPGVDTVSLATWLAHTGGLTPVSIGDAFRTTVRAGTALGLRDAVAVARLLDERGQGPEVVVQLALADDDMAARLRRTCGGCGSALHVSHRRPRHEGVCGLCGGALGLPDEVVAARIENYRRQADPVVAYFRGAGVLRVVDGSAGYDGITAELRPVMTAPGQGA